MRVLIVDDEAAARRRLALMLSELDVEVVGEAGDGVTALELAAELRPDVLLLDIVMPEVDGLDVARSLTPPRPLVIFQTAHDEFALRAFEHEALDYLLKPVTRARLEQALERARARLAATESIALDAGLLARLRASLLPAASRARPARLLVNDGTAHRLVALRDIARFVAGRGVVRVLTARGELLTGASLGEIETRTAGAFVRVNRGELINIELVDRILTEADGSATLVLKDGSRAHVSRRRAADVRRALEG